MSSKYSAHLAVDFISGWYLSYTVFAYLFTPAYPHLKFSHSHSHKGLKEKPKIFAFNATRDMSCLTCAYILCIQSKFGLSSLIDSRFKYLIDNKSNIKLLWNGIKCLVRLTQPLRKQPQCEQY